MTSPRPSGEDPGHAAVHGLVHGPVHGPGHDPDHDEVEAEPLELHPIWQQDNVRLHSVGVDIGSAGTQVAFSRLHLRRSGESLTSRYVVVGRETIFESDFVLTPYTDDLRIDAGALGVILDKAYAAAGLRPEQVDTGVVILTGEALRRLNAEPIAAVVSERAGDLVCASAGHHMEASLAAFGSGAARISHELAGRVLNVDIGGGTTKLSLLDCGRLVQTAALHVGGRLLALDPEGRIDRLEPAGRGHAAAAGFDWAVGDAVEGRDLVAVAEEMARLVLEAVRPSPTSARLRELYLTPPLRATGPLAGVVFSGGVGEFVYGLESRDFGDLGGRLGAALRDRIATGALPAPLLPGGQRIRATVLGASQYTVQLSGITSHVESAERTLPRRNVQVLRPPYELGRVVDPHDVAHAVRAHVAGFGLEDSREDLAIAVPWSGDPAYARLRGLAEGLVGGLSARIAAGLPLYLMTEADIARTLGALLSEELGVGNDLLILDGVELKDFDFVDLGRLRQPSKTVPVTVKSLLFGEMAGPPL